MFSWTKVYSLDFSSPTINSILILFLAMISCGWARLLLAHSRAASCTKSIKYKCGTLEPDSPFVSVIVPARNEIRYLRRCLVSILSQNYTNLEVIVVDDCSSDDTPKIATSIQDSRLKIINLKETPSGWSGKSWASQVGYLASAGELLLFTDADSFFYNREFISRTVSFLQNEGAHVATGLPLIELPDFCSKLIMPIYNLFSILSAPSARDISDTNPKKGYLIGSFFIINKKLLEKIGGFHSVRDSIQEDTDLGACIKKQGYPIRAIKVSDSIAALWSRDTKTLVEGIRRIVSYHLSSNKKNLILDIFMIFSMVTLPFILLMYNLYFNGNNYPILFWNALLCILPCLAVSIIGATKHSLSSLYSILVLFGSSFLLTLYLANLVSLGSLPISRVVHWKGRKYVRPRESSMLFARRRPGSSAASP
jgi:chlorobactene glucosyltransferase